MSKNIDIEVQSFYKEVQSFYDDISIKVFNHSSKRLTKLVLVGLKDDISRYHGAIEVLAKSRYGNTAGPILRTMIEIYRNMFLLYKVNHELVSFRFLWNAELTRPGGVHEDRKENYQYDCNRCLDRESQEVANKWLIKEEKGEKQLFG